MSKNYSCNPKSRQNYYSIVLRHDSSTQWMIENPILLFGEYGVEDDTHKVKRGDGESRWENLPYETFGIESIVTFSNLKGDVSDNDQLVEALDTKVAKEDFKATGGNIISALNIIREDGSICKIEKHTTNILSGDTSTQTLLIQSPDESLHGVWSVGSNGITTLQLTAVSTIYEFTPNTSYSKNQLCFFENDLYISTVDIESAEEFDKDKWKLVGANDAHEISFDNSNTELESDNVQDALEELDKSISEVESQLTWKDYD